MKGEIFVCNSYEEVSNATNNLDKAVLCDIRCNILGVEKEVKDTKGIYNISKDRFSSAVVPYYNLIQHKDYFNGFAESLNRLNIKFKMEIKQSGDRAFADIEFKDRNIKFENLNEEFITGIRISNSYNKTRGLSVCLKYKRLACSNGMILSRTEQTVSIKHHSKIVSELESFIELKINQIINESNELKTWVSSSIADSIEWSLACKILEKLFNEVRHREEILKRLGISIIVIDKKKKLYSYVQETNDKKEKLTRWDIYNAITNYITFGEHITPHIEDLFNKSAEKLLITPLAKMPISTKVAI